MIDLGWLRPDDRVYIAVHNDDGGASWRYRIYSNGKLVRSGRKEGIGPVGYPAERGMVLEREFTASGALIGRIGCDGPRHVTHAVPHYQRSPDVAGVPVVAKEELHWSISRSPEDEIHTLGEHALLALFALGVAVALLWPPMRKLVEDLPNRVLVGTLTLGAAIEIAVGLLPNLGWAGSWLLLQVIGALLLAMAVVVAFAFHTQSP